MNVETQAHRSERRAVETRQTRNWWTVVGAILVVAGYAAAVVVGTSARGSPELSDDAQVVLVGTAPSLGVVGALLAFVGTRRTTLRAFSWLVLGLGVLLVAGTLAVLAMIVIALNGLD